MLSVMNEWLRTLHESEKRILSRLLQMEMESGEHCFRQLCQDITHHIGKVIFYIIMLRSRNSLMMSNMANRFLVLLMLTVNSTLLIKVGTLTAEKQV